MPEIAGEATLVAAKYKQKMKKSCLRRRQRGFVVSFGFSEDAERECAAFHKRTRRIIKLLTVKEILDEE